MSCLATLRLLTVLSLRGATADPPASDGSTGSSSTPATSSTAPTPDTGEDAVTTGATGPIDAACDTISQGCPEGHKVHRRQPGLHDPFQGTASVPDNAGAGG